MILPHWICEMCTHSQVEVVVVFKAEMWDLQLEEETLCLFYIVYAEDQFLQSYQENGTIKALIYTNVYNYTSHSQTTTNWLQSSSIWCVLYVSIVCTIATF